MFPSLTAEEIRFQGHGGDEIAGYLARPGGSGPFPGVAVLHHMTGLDEATLEIVNRFAAHGYVSVSPSLHFREGAEAAPDDAAAAKRPPRTKGPDDDRQAERDPLERAAPWDRAVGAVHGQLAPRNWVS